MVALDRLHSRLPVLLTRSVSEGECLRRSMPEALFDDAAVETLALADASG